MPVLYIVGSGRSGSTILERALGEPPGYVNVGELIDLCRRVAPHDERCGCGQAYTTCPFWSEVAARLPLPAGDWWERMHLLQRQVARQRHLPWLLAPVAPRRLREAVDEYGAMYAALYETVRSVSRASVVVDASKWPAQAAALVRGGIDVRVLHLHRDPRGVAYSQSKTGVVRPHDASGSDLMSSTRPLEAAFRWSLTQAESTALRRLGVPWTRLGYDDFMHDPAAAMRRVLTELDLAAADLGFVSGRTLWMEPSHGLSGNPSRFGSAEVVLRPDEAWREGLRPRDRALVAAMTLPARRLWARPSRAAAPPRTQWPSVTVVLPTSRRPQQVREALASVVSQTYPGVVETIVVHDGEPTDPGLTSFAAPDRPVRVVTNVRTRGLAGARNTGISLAAGELLAGCDDDDTWHPQKLERQAAALLADDDLVLVGSGIRLLLPDGRVKVRRGRAERISQRLLLRNRVKELHSSTMLMRRSAITRIGEYDESLPGGYAEDYDWVLRAVRVGGVGLVPAPLADIRKDGGSYYVGRADNAVLGMEALLAKHPELRGSRRGHARILGQIAFNRAAQAGGRGAALRGSVSAIGRWPLSPYPYLALLLIVSRAEPDHLRQLVRRTTGRGLA